MPLAIALPPETIFHANTLASTTAATGLLPTFLAFLLPCLPFSTVWPADWRLPPQAPSVCEGLVVNDTGPLAGQLACVGKISIQFGGCELFPKKEQQFPQLFLPQNDLDLGYGIQVQSALG